MLKENTLYVLVFSFILLLVSNSFANNITGFPKDVKAKLSKTSYYGDCPGDYDCDGVKDEDDLDDDNDGILDTDEGYLSDLASYELTCNKDWWSPASDAYDEGYSKIKYTFSNGSYAIIENHSVSSGNGCMKIPDNISHRKNYFTDNVPQSTWSPSLTETSGKVKWSEIHPLYMKFDLIKSDVEYSIKFFNPDGSKKTVLNPVLHFDRIGSSEGFGPNKKPATVRISLKDNRTWSKLSGTEDFGVTSNTVSDITTKKGTTDAVVNNFIDTTVGNDAGAAAGSVVIKGSYTELNIVAENPNNSTAKDAALMMILINTVEGQAALDTDNDGIPDYHDLDSDNDGCGDAMEGGADNIKESDLVQVTEGKLADVNVYYSHNLGNTVDSSGVPKIVSPSQPVGNSIVVNSFNLTVDKALESPVVEENGTATYSAIASGGILDKPISYRWEFSSDYKQWYSFEDFYGAEVAGNISGVLENGQATEITLSNIQFLLNNTAIRVYFSQEEHACGTAIESAGYIYIKKGDNTKPAVTFDPIVICQGNPDGLALPTTSKEGIEGTWSPDKINDQMTRDYVFTPSGSFADQYSEGFMKVHVYSSEDIEFSQIQPICVGQKVFLPTTDADGASVSGIWTIDGQTPLDGNSYLMEKETEFTFIPSGDKVCSPPAHMTVKTMACDNTKIDPTFEDITLCQDDEHEFPDTSPNGVEGTWDVSTVDTSTPGKFYYLFTPSNLNKFNIKQVSVTVKDCSRKELSFSFSDICKDQVFELPKKSNEGIEGVWSPLTVDTSKEGEQNFIFKPNDSNYQSFSAVLKVTNCELSFSIDDICLGSKFNLPVISDEGILGSWDKRFDSSTLGESTYIFTADDKKYPESKTVTVNVIDCDTDVVVHNIITLKQDNLNDFLKIRNIDKFPDNSIRIYDRWGTQVFYKESFNSSIKWSGVTTSKYSLDNSQKLPTDTYFYVLVYKDDNGEVIVLKDWIYIKSFK